MIKTSKARVMIARFLLPLLVVWLAIFPSRSYAVLPALAFAEVLGTAVESFVIRSVARQVISTVGTAANDATWASNFSSWLAAARVIGSVVFNVSGLQGQSVPITDVEVSTNGNSSELTVGPLGSVYAITSPAFVPYILTISGVEEDAPNFGPQADEQTAKANLAAWWNSVATANGQIVGWLPSYPCGDVVCYPFEMAYGGSDTMRLMAVQAELADGVGRVVGTPGNWSADITDPDWTDAQKAEISGEAALRFRGQTLASGAPAVIDMVAEGTALRFQYKEAVSPDLLRERKALTDDLLIPISFDEATFSGVIDTAPASSSSSTTSTIVFPTDYARQGEAGAAAAAVVTALSPLSVTAAVDDPIEPLPDAMPWFGETFTALSGWTMPGHVSACPTPSLDLSMVLGAGHVYTMSDHCTLFQDNAAPMRSAAIVGWLILALFVFLRA